ncbi:MAG TPA: polyprenyl synthetase family protein [Acidimicrobiales bacterium]|nr:polyprenyl synthetase family protein [Acidimicrobiales bacterium]
MTPTTAVAQVLDRARELTQPLMREAVGRLTPSIRNVVSYHLGWTGPDGVATDGKGGKGIRPALSVLSAEAAWSGPEVGAPGGVAIELVHNFSLIHDDLMDGDLERRHRPTVWALWGTGTAVLAGDALSNLANEVLLSTANPAAPAASLALGEAVAEMIAGQADDLAFEKRPVVSIEECMAMSTAKTGALLGCAASIGAILAGAPPATVRALRDFGRHLGVAFQAVDDLLGIWGDPATTGKPAGNDIRQRKKSMPIVAALTAGDDEAQELSTILFGPSEELGSDEVARATWLVEASGGREWTAARAKAHLDAALGSLERARLSAVPRRALADLAVYVVERES